MSEYSECYLRVQVYFLLAWKWLWDVSSGCHMRKYPFGKAWSRYIFFRKRVMRTMSYWSLYLCARQRTHASSRVVEWLNSLCSMAYLCLKRPLSRIIPQIQPETLFFGADWVWCPSRDEWIKRAREQLQPGWPLACHLQLFRVVRPVG